MESPLKYFAGLTDPRVERTKSICSKNSVYDHCGGFKRCRSWNDIADYGESKRDWLGGFLTLPGGSRRRHLQPRFSALDPLELENCFLGWLRLWPS